jgi:hypothetical protein
MSLMTLDCPECHEERLFEPPHNPASCPDQAASPAEECPEVACVECGTALTLGFAIPPGIPQREQRPRSTKGPRRTPPRRPQRAA